MLIVRVPPWAATGQSFTVPVDADPSMPRTATQPTPDLDVTGIDIARAAVFSGRPWHLLHQPHHGSNAEFAQWRVTSCLRLIEPNGSSLRRPAIFHSEVDATEKGHLNFALGGAMTKAYLEAKLGIFWLAHYSLVKKSPRYRVLRRVPGFSEPDYIGMDSQYRFFAAEAKGRVSLDAATKKSLNCKKQTGIVNSVNGQIILQRYGVAAITGGSHIQLYATDPEVEIELPKPSEWLASFYEYVRAVCGPEGEVSEAENTPESWTQVSFDLPEQVSQWVSEGADPAEWEGLASRTREAYRESIVLPDLTVMSVSSQS
ncbi:hypothetical protein [Microbacterium lacticum]|nr:hypothetical protein [Microbacterium lacticum]